MLCPHCTVVVVGVSRAPENLSKNSKMGPDCVQSNRVFAEVPSATFEEKKTMGVYYKNRALTISLALAASGILTCGMALADIFLPRGSAIVLLASVPLLGALAFGALIAFAWTCELLDRRGYLPVPRRKACTPRKSWQVVSARGPILPSPDEFQPVPKTALPPRPLIDYVVNLRGRMHLRGNRAAYGRHGQ